ncbi:MAG: hypothetical protein ACOH2D_14855 [Gelidibacter sp.]
MKTLPTKVGTLGGIVACTFPHIGRQELLATCILAILGAVISFLTTLLLRQIFRWASKFFKL